MTIQYKALDGTVFAKKADALKRDQLCIKVSKIVDDKCFHGMQDNDIRNMLMELVEEGTVTIK